MDIYSPLLNKIRQSTKRTDLTHRLSLYVTNGDDDGVGNTLELMADTEGSKHELAQAFLTGKEVRRRPDVAIKLLEQLAEKGYTPAQKSLGDAQRQNLVTSPDLKSQFYWYAKAAQSGDAESQYQLAIMYANGESRERNLKLSGMWLSYASKQGHLDATHGLGWMYFLGEGVKECKKTALAYFYQAATQNHTESQLLLGKLYYKGEVTRHDPKMALHWLTLASSSGSVDADCLLGRMYRDMPDDGTGRNLDKAMQYFCKAIKAGSTEAASEMQSMAIMYSSK